MKVCILTNILAPYRIGLFEALAKRVDELTVLLMASGHDNRLWEIPQHGFATKVLRGLHIKAPGFEEPFHLNTGVSRVLDEIDPDVVISGGYTLANVAAYLFCRRRRRIHISWGELTLLDGAQHSIVRRMLRRYLISGSDAVIASSSVSRAAFEHYGARPDRALLSVMPVDVHAFRAMADAFRGTQEYVELRRRYDDGCLLSIGRLIDIKGYPELFGIYRELLRHRPQLKLLIAGEGAQRESYEALVEREGWTGVDFLGYLQPRELIKYLCVADAFVFHTRYDPFGAVLSEALATGTPAVTSIHAAATHDLVADGISGYAIDPADTVQSVAAIDRVLDATDDERRAMAAAGWASVKEWDFDSAADSIAELLLRVLRERDALPGARAESSAT